MFKNIVVPVDFTAKNVEAIEIACELAEHGNGRIALLHVIETIKHIPFEEIEDFYTKLEESAAEKIERMANDYGGKGYKIDKKILFGRRSQVIVQYVQENHVDLIVLSSHPIDPKNTEASFSTISYKVGVFAPCPVLLVK